MVLLDGFVGDLQLILRQARGFELLGNQVARGDLIFFVFGVARDAQHFHAILQRLRNGVQHVGGADEHDLREIVFDVEIVVGEGVIQLGVQHFHQRRRRIAAEIHGHLVHFVQHEHGIGGAGLAHHLDDLAGQGADIGAAMAANFSLIAHAAEGYAHEFTSRGAADGHRERSLADAWRPEEAENRALGILYQLANGEIFEDAVFDLVQAVMIFGENHFGALDVANFLRALLPGHRQQPVQIVARYGGFGGHRRHHFQPLQFLHGLFLRPFGHAGSFDLLFQLLDFVGFAAAQFFLNGLQLFVEVVLFLRAFHLALHARIDGAIHVQLFDFDFQNVGDAVQALQRLEKLQQFLLFFDGNLQVRGDRVGKLAGIFDAHGGDHRVVIQALRELHVLLEQPGDALGSLLQLRGRLGLGQ